MYKQLLVPIDGSKLSAKATDEAIKLALWLTAGVVFLHVSPAYQPPVVMEGMIIDYPNESDYRKSVGKQAAAMLEKAAKKADASDVPCKTVHIIDDSVWETIISAAKKNKCDAIVMASHGRRGLSAVLLGSETQKVLTHSKLPVLVVR
jgi:nucleotide-binding universal stress UspA family protein